MREIFTDETLRQHLELYSTDVSHSLDSRGSFANLCHQLVLTLEHRGQLTNFGDYLCRLPETRPHRPRIRRLFMKSGSPGECPYLGLLAFAQKDADVFFGREAEIDDLLDRVQSRRWVSVEGPSGVGKSSLVHAGLLAGLPRTWVSLKLRPGTHPWDTLTDAVWDSLAGAPRPARADFHLAPQGFRDFVYQRTSGGSQLLLVVDQLEETLTFADPAQTRSFAEAIERVLAEDSLRFCLVTTIRSDQVEGLVDRLPALGTLLNKPWAARYVVAPMEREALHSAIVEPAERRNVPLESGLAERICNDALSRPGETPGGSLPLVAHLLHELWWKCNGSSSLTHVAYDKLGGVEGALTSSADHTLNEIKRVNPSTVQRVRSLLLELATVDSSGRATRRELPLKTALELLDGDKALLDLLSSGRTTHSGALMRLIVVHGAGDCARVDLIHERLLTGWPTLHSWLSAVAEQKRISEEFREAARQWDRDGREPDALPAGKLLERYMSAKPDSADRDTQDAFQDALWAKRDRLHRENTWQRQKFILRTCGVIIGVSFALLAIWRKWEMEAMETAHENELTAAELRHNTLDDQLIQQRHAAAEAVVAANRASEDADAAALRATSLRTALSECERKVAQRDTAPSSTCTNYVTRITRASGAARQRDVDALFKCWIDGALAHERTRFAEFLRSSEDALLKRTVRSALPRTVQWTEFAFLSPQRTPGSPIRGGTIQLNPASAR